MSMSNPASSSSSSSLLWRETPVFWIVFLLTLIVAAIPFWDGLTIMVKYWDRDEYSHSYILPFIAAYLAWQRQGDLVRQKFTGSWIALALLLFGYFVFVAGELSSLYTIVQYGYLVVLVALVWALLGWQAFKTVWAPLLVLFFMVPLPNFLYENLSAKLQLISSELGVGFIRLFDIPVYLSGNVIDLGALQLQVVDACSGLRYLFPLMSIGFIVAYFFKAPLWQRVVVFASTIPITVGMNSFRVGVIGVTVEYWGIKMAEGFIHDFEGWVVFMASLGLLLVEMWLLMKLFNKNKKFSDVFAIELPAKIDFSKSAASNRSIPKPFIVAIGMVVAVAASSFVMPERNDRVPERKSFHLFPQYFGKWSGTKSYLEKKYIDALKLSDHTVINYRNNEGTQIELYIAWYDQQRKGASIHSPRTCLPGGGWRMVDFGQHAIEDTQIHGVPLKVNRAILEKGDYKSIVYYWFQQRGRVITNEFAAKWYLFWDAMTIQRTDGALVRLVAVVPKSKSVQDVESEMYEFVQKSAIHIDDFVPQ